MKSRFKPEELTEHQIFWMGAVHPEGCQCGDQTCYQDEWLNLQCCELNCYAEGPYCYGPHEESDSTVEECCPENCLAKGPACYSGHDENEEG